MATVKKTIRRDIKDEKGAHAGYHKLAKRLRKGGNKAGSRTVLEIAKDEAHHKKLLTKLQRKVSKPKKKGSKRK